MWKLAVVMVAAMAARADAFCGFFIDSGGAEMFADASQVVLMRDGTRTVLSMENTYAGPLQDFAIVIPVPTVLHQQDVRTLPKSVFDKVNAMTAPRLVEYWETDPCYIPEGYSVDARDFSKHSSMPEYVPSVKIEAQFDVDEYKIVILSAQDSTGLAHFLKAQHYKIPEGAEPLLRPYVEAGSKFFVAKVDPKKVKFEHGKAVLSPLRFFYDSDEFMLPIRLGLANSGGTQDLIVNIISDGQRYDVANYPNATMPTNILVEDSVRKRFAEFYAALFDRTLQQHPGAVITEYSWAAGNCDPCPVPPLKDEELKLLGEDVIAPLPPPPPSSTTSSESDDMWLGPDDPTPRHDFVITRLHARYGKDSAAADLVFRKAEPIEGGRQRRREGKLSHGSEPSSSNNFQARYIIVHPWTEPIECTEPHRGGLGSRGQNYRTALGAATDQASAPRGKVELQNLVDEDLPEIAVKRGEKLFPPLPVPVSRPPRAQGCGCRTADAPASLWIGVAILGMLRRRRRDRLACPHAAPHVSVRDRIGLGTGRTSREARLRKGE